MRRKDNKIEKFFSLNGSLLGALMRIKLLIDHKLKATGGF
jgi:hypothetical protein